MKRIINTFKYGSPAVKLTLLATIICGLATAGLLACAFIFGQLIWFFACVFAGFVTVSLAQTFAIQGGMSNEDSKKNSVKNSGKDDSEKKYSGEDAQNFDGTEYDEENDGEIDFSSFEKEAGKDGNKKSGKKNKQKNKKQKLKKLKKKNNNKKNKEDNYPEDEDDKLDKIKRAKDKKNKKEKIKKKKVIKEKTISEKNDKERKPKNQALISKRVMKKKPKKVALKKDIPIVKKATVSDLDYKAMVKKDIKESKRSMAKKEKLAEEEFVSEEAGASRGFVPEPLNAETVKQYNIKKIRKTLHKYKVKRDHKLAMIDRCETYNISQTPAYIWVDGNDFHILLIEQEPRHLVLSTFKVGRIKYLKKQPVNINTDYEAFNVKSMITDLFRPYLPDYNQSNVDSDLNYYKNLYGIGPGIYFTNNSAKQLIDFFGFGMDVDDKVTESKRVNLYFKDAYKANIMVRDNVLDANGYADRISSILEEMAASNLSYNEFKETLNLMIKNKFITKEFGMYYMEVRDKKHS
ncbi:MAG: hypothetical protein IJ141_02895 [Lachnospiraceae bacterium]|nr:hypothetical protein [Lachnospiraceae bacterium]